VTRRRKSGGAAARFLGRPFGRARRRPDTSDRKRSDLIGRDLAPMRLLAARRSRLLPVALVGALVAGLCLTALRIDLIRQRYDLAAAMQEEMELLEERRLLTARVRRLRDPARLARLAKSLGFERPDRVIELGTPEPAAEARP
jgi:hypothetical protein